MVVGQPGVPLQNHSPDTGRAPEDCRLGQICAKLLAAELSAIDSSQGGLNVNLYKYGYL